MRRFDDPAAPPSAPTEGGAGAGVPCPPSGMAMMMERAPRIGDVPLLALAVIARSIPHPYGLKTRDYRALLVEALEAEGWTCRTHVRVDSRGTNDGYAGILDLVAHPPTPPGATQLARPVLVEIDKASIQAKTLAKLSRWPHAHAGKVVILTRATHHPAVAGVDSIIPLA